MIGGSGKRDFGDTHNSTWNVIANWALVALLVSFLSWENLPIWV
jgi:hypothetical protein